MRLPSPIPGLALGGDIKSAPCAVRGSDVFQFETLGDLAEPAVLRSLVDLVSRIEELCGFKPEWLACDAHPGYHSSRLARGSRIPVTSIQHHHAHIEACKAEHGLEGPMIGLAADGTGFGDDGGVWGCELLICDGTDFKRIGHLLPFAITPGDASATEPWRPAACALFKLFGSEWTRHIIGDEHLSDELIDIMGKRLDSGKGLLPCTSLGRLFDAAAHITGICQENNREEEAAVALENAATAAWPPSDQPSCPTVMENGRYIFDWRPIIHELAENAIGATRRRPASELAAMFHLSVADMLANGVAMACEDIGQKEAALSGGCFFNRLLTKHITEKLARRGISSYIHTRTPPGDGGIALGQASVAAHRLNDGVNFAIEQQPIM